VLRTVIWPERDEVTGEQRRLHNKELYNLYSSPNVILVIKLRRRWSGHVTLIGRAEVHTGLWCRNLSEREYLKDLDVDGRIILK
jgi:hypothetical protein